MARTQKELNCLNCVRVRRLLGAVMSGLSSSHPVSSAEEEETGFSSSGDLGLGGTVGMRLPVCGY